MNSRLLSQIIPLEKDALKLVSEMKPVLYVLKNNKEKQHLGLVAQDTIALEPLLVGKGDAMQVDYEALTIILLKAIQQLKDEIEELKGDRAMDTEKIIRRKKAVI